MSNKRLAHKVLLRSLNRLVEDLDMFEQSCIGLGHIEGTIEEVTTYLFEYWRDPNKVSMQKLCVAVDLLKLPAED